MILAFKTIFLYNRAKSCRMIKQIGLIALVAIGLTLIIPGTNVEAKDNPTQVPIGHHQMQAAGSNMTGAAANTTGATANTTGANTTHGSSLPTVNPAGHGKDNPEQIPVS